MSTVLIDADSVVYRAGFAGEVTSLQIAYEDKDGAFHTKGFIPDPKLGSARKQLDKFRGGIVLCPIRIPDFNDIVCLFGTD